MWGRDTSRRTPSSFWGSEGDMAQTFPLQSRAGSGGAGWSSRAGKRPRSKCQCWAALAGLGQGHPFLLHLILCQEQVQTLPRENTKGGKRGERHPWKRHHQCWRLESPLGIGEPRSGPRLLLFFLWGHWKHLGCSSSCQVAKQDAGCPLPVLGVKWLSKTMHQLTGRAETS